MMLFLFFMFFTLSTIQFFIFVLIFFLRSPPNIFYVKVLKYGYLNVILEAEK